MSFRVALTLFLLGGGLIAPGLLVALPGWWRIGAVFGGVALWCVCLIWDLVDRARLGLRLARRSRAIDCRMKAGMVEERQQTIRRGRSAAKAQALRQRGRLLADWIRGDDRERRSQRA